MIFITLGSQKFQFNRLLRAADELIASGALQEEVFAQTGYSDYKPKHFAFQPFLNREEYAARIRQAEIVITHGGSGAIIGAVKAGKKVIAVPRRQQFGEHVDDHQLQLVRQFSRTNIAYACDDCMKLAEAVEKVRNMSFLPYQSCTDRIIESIDEYIRSL